MKAHHPKANERRAYHQAGHAVARHYLKHAGPDRSVAIASGSTGGSGSGHMGHAPPYPRPPPGMVLDEALARIQVCLAAGIAEKRFAGRWEKAAVYADLERAVEFALRVSYKPETEALLHWLQVRTEHLVDFYWPDVEAVARSLLWRKALKGEDVAEVIRSEGTAA